MYDSKDFKTQYEDGMCPRFTNPSMDFLQLTYNIKMKALTIMKKTKLVVWVMMALLPFFWACEKEGCLPYQGEIFPSSASGGMFGVSCNGVLIKVTNTSVNSEFNWRGGIEQNVVTARIPEGMGFEDFFGFPIDPAKATRKFYFDFRDLQEDEYNMCPHLDEEPSRQVYITRFSFERCNN